MNDELKDKLKFLGLRHTLETWEELFLEAKKNQPSYHSFFTGIIEKEFGWQKDRARAARIKRANIPEIRVMETFPFAQQPKLKKKLVLEIYDSLQFITEKQDMVFIGPTGCGKSGLATAFLIQALNQGYRGYFIEFGKLVEILFQSRADHTESRALRKFQRYDVLLVDEVGYNAPEKEQAELFFQLMKSRHGRGATLITSQLGFEEWGGFMQNKHLTAALLDRLTVNCGIFNMNECISIRPKKIVYATEKQDH